MTRRLNAGKRSCARHTERRRRRQNLCEKVEDEIMERI
jgi:hypothetical protein